MLAAAPMDREDDLARALVDVGDDIRDEGAQKLLAGAHRHAGRVQAASRSSPKPERSGAWTDAVGVSPSSRASQALTRWSEASQLFSSWAAIRRLSGSHAA